jgi:hypothetical protein
VSRDDAGKHVPVPKMVKDRLIRIETKLERFNEVINGRLDEIEEEVKRGANTVEGEDTARDGATRL